MRRAGVIVAVLVLTVFELFVARLDWIWSYEARSSTGIVDVLEREVLGRVDDPSVVFLGSSRVRDAVLPREFENHLGLPSGSVLNLGLTDGEGFDSLTLYERNRGILSRAEVIVIGVELSDFSMNTTANARFRRYASLEERLAWPGGDRVSLLVGHFWRTYDARDQIRGLVTSLWRGRSKTVPIDSTGRIVWRDQVDAGPPTVDYDRVVKGLEGDEPGMGQARYVDELVDLLNQDGVRAWIIHVPLRDEVAKALDRANPELVRQLLASVREFEGVSGTDAPWMASNVQDLDDTGFYDYGHPATKGARILTMHYARLLESTVSKSPLQRDSVATPKFSSRFRHVQSDRTLMTVENQKLVPSARTAAAQTTR